MHKYHIDWCKITTSKLNDDAKFGAPLVYRISKEKNIGISNPMESAP